MKQLRFGLSGLLSALILAALAACTSAPTKQQEGAPVVDGKSGPPPVVVDRPAVKPADPITKPFQSDDPSRAALKDPKNILSKRSVFFDYDSNLV